MVKVTDVQKSYIYALQKELLYYVLFIVIIFYIYNNYRRSLTFVLVSSTAANSVRLINYIHRHTYVVT